MTAQVNSSQLIFPQNKVDFEKYDLDAYNKTVGRKSSKTMRYVGSLCLSAILGGIVFPQGPLIRNSLDGFIYSLKFFPMISLPYFSVYNLGTYSTSVEDLHLYKEQILEKKEEIKDKRIVYLLVTRGYNLNTVENSSDSVRFWIKEIRERYGLSLNIETWIVTEEDTFKRGKQTYTRLEEKGSKIIVVPTDYETKNQSKFKARALNYASERRQELGIDTERDWIYHQDEETMVGEDTIFGNLAFITGSSDKLMGQGIILYPQDWEDSTVGMQEVARSSDDFRLLYPVRTIGLPIWGYHGSHFICRADVENDVGWDFGETKVEDLLFNIKIMSKYGNVVGFMKGFAYEKPPLNANDHLRQRRRWILGIIDTLKRKDVPLKYKLPSLYGLISWYSALPSLGAIVLSIIYPTGGLFPYSGILGGFIWYSMYNIYRNGYELHKGYTIKGYKRPFISLVYQSAFGMVLEGIAPWYSIVKRTTKYECIQKDKEKVETAYKIQ
jgi:egghead protein (zeste-white 4 protein)